jgi:ferredoxin-type protein NapG
MKEKSMATRRKVIQRMFEGAVFLGGGGLIWGSSIKANSKSDYVLRPPGALKEKDFLKACIKCGQCVEACPYDTLKLAQPGDGIANGTPFFEPRTIPCYLCTDMPCTDSCPSGALDLKLLTKEEDKPDINNSKMGLAVIHKESCVAYWGIQCEACYRACPLMDKAISLKYEENTVTGKHAKLLPIVHSDVCTGCGVCEQVCIVEKAAIFVLPIDKSTGEVGDHYIKSWDKSDEDRIKENFKSADDEKDIESAIDYLNDDDLIDE